MPKLIKIAETKDLTPGQAAAFDLEGQRIALFNVEGTYYAIGDSCTHRGGPLSEGDVQGTKVTCPWHGADFDLKTGAVLGPPAQKGVPRPAQRWSASPPSITLLPGSESVRAKMKAPANAKAAKLAKATVLCVPPWWRLLMAPYARHRCGWAADWRILDGEQGAPGIRPRDPRHQGSQIAVVRERAGR